MQNPVHCPPNCLSVFRHSWTMRWVCSVHSRYVSLLMVQEQLSVTKRLQLSYFSVEQLWSMFQKILWELLVGLSPVTKNRNLLVIIYFIGFPSSLSPFSTLSLWSWMSHLHQNSCLRVCFGECKRKEPYSLGIWCRMLWVIWNKIAFISKTQGRIKDFNFILMSILILS